MPSIPDKEMKSFKFCVIFGIYFSLMIVAMISTLLIIFMPTIFIGIIMMIIYVVWIIFGPKLVRLC